MSVFFILNYTFRLKNFINLHTKIGGERNGKNNQGRELASANCTFGLVRAMSFL